jgi:rubrerythrin
MLQDSQIKALMLVHEFEKSLGDLYTVFNAQFPEYSAIWELLIKEEYEHAEAVRKLYRLTYDKKVVFDEGKIKPEGVQAILDYLKPIYENAQNSKYTVKKALTIACDLEKSIIENNIFDYFKGTDEIQNTINFLVFGTKRHAEILKAELAKQK